jgi:predicted metal-dependent phosphoesterase TrpH
MKCDFHIHTYYSYDSNSLPKEIVEKALQKGLDCLAITDHEEVGGAKEVMECALGKPILIIPGIEVKSRKGDILGLNVREIIPAGLSVKETIKRIQGQGGMAIIAHPFATLYHFKGDLKDFLGEIDGIEAFNAAIFSSENKRALEFAKKNNLAFTAGSDAHFPDSVGNAYLEIPGDDLSIEEVLLAVKNKKGKICGKEISFFGKITDHVKRNLSKFKLLC